MSRPLRTNIAAHDVEEQVPRALGRPDRRSRVTRWGGEHEAIQVRPGAADGDQRNQRGMQGLLGGVVAGGQNFERVTQFAQRIGSQDGEQGFLIREVAIRRRARDTSAGTDFAQRHRVDSADVEQRPGGIEQRPPGRRGSLRSPRHPQEHKPKPQ